MKLPTGWKLQRIEEIADVKGGKRLPKGYSLVKENTGFPYIRVTDMKNGTVDESGILYIPMDVAPKISRYIINKGDVFISVAGNGLGITGIIPESLDGANLTENADKLTNLKINQKFLFEVLRSPIIQNKVEAEKTQNAQPKLALTRIKGFEIPVPPLPEQKKIAQILSTWDKAITTTEKLLTNSQQQKKALMQQLLTGKKRLLDKNGVRFSVDWKKYQLEDLFSFKKGKGLSKADLSESGTNKCILYGELYTRYSEVVKKVYSRTNLSDGTPSVCGDILIPSSTTTSGIDLANATAILEDNVLLGGDINILRAKKKLSAPFFAHLLTHVKKHEIASRAKGITIIHLYSTDLKDIGAFIPTELIEQQKIAEVLSVADQEISSLKQKLDALKQEKKALMQQLLTGKRRVKIEEAA